MRYIAILVVLLSFPLFVSWLKASERNRMWGYFAIGLLPFVVNSWNLDASLISWAAWSGFAKGLTITALDTLCLAILVTHQRPRGLPPFTGYVIAYLIAATLSIAMTTVHMASFFYAFQLTRVLIVFLAVAKVAANPRAVRQIVLGLAVGISYQAGWTVWQRANGAFQAAGTMGHQNLLGMMTHFALLPVMAMMLSGVRNRILMVGLVSGLLVMALGASRGTIGFGTAAIGLLLVVSMIRRNTPYKRKIFTAGLVALIAIAPLTYSSLNKRYSERINTEGDERAAFERAASAMWSDHPMGVGGNQYVVVANTSGYSERAGVIWNWNSRAAHVHNTYLLVAAETGWLGLITFVAMLGAAILKGLQFAFKDRRDPRGDIVLGCTMAIITATGQIFYEWVFVTYQSQYVFVISLGIIAAMIRARKAERSARRRPPENTGDAATASQSGRSQSQSGLVGA